VKLRTGALHRSRVSLCPYLDEGKGVSPSWRTSHKSLVQEFEYTCPTLMVTRLCKFLDCAEHHPYTHLNVSKSVGVMYCKNFPCFACAHVLYGTILARTLMTVSFGQACRKSQLLVKAGLELINTTAF